MKYLKKGKINLKLKFRIILELDSTTIATKVADGDANQKKQDTITSFFSSTAESIKNSFFSF
jgi:hypothetical protein